MHVIRVTVLDKENLPRIMLFALKARRVRGLLDGLVHAKDDTVREIDYGWEMLSYWNKASKL